MTYPSKYSACCTLGNIKDRDLGVCHAGPSLAIGYCAIHRGIETNNNTPNHKNNHSFHPKPLLVLRHQLMLGHSQHPQSRPPQGFRAKAPVNWSSQSSSTGRMMMIMMLMLMMMMIMMLMLMLMSMTMMLVLVMMMMMLMLNIGLVGVLAQGRRMLIRQTAASSKLSFEWLDFRTFPEPHALCILPKLFKHCYLLWAFCSRDRKRYELRYSSVITCIDDLQTEAA